MISALDNLSAVSVLDISSSKSSANGLRTGMSGVTSGLRGLGLISNETAAALSVATGALSVATGVLGITSIVKARITAKTAQETAQSAALVAANSWNPEGWSTIALATGAAAAASIGMYALITTIRADLSTPTGRQDAISGVQAAMP